MIIEELKNRIQKQYKIYNKWAKKEDLTCFRIYHKDLPNFPLTIDWIDNNTVCWIYNRTRDDSKEKQQEFEKNVEETILVALKVNPDQLFIKTREKQKGLNNQYKKLSIESKTKIIKENNLKFEINLTDYLDIGLFLDHRKTRQYVQSISQNTLTITL